MNTTTTTTTTDSGLFYIVEEEYGDPRYEADSDVIAIVAYPDDPDDGEGFDDWIRDRAAWGPYATMDDAEGAVREIFGEVRDSYGADDGGCRFDPNDFDIYAAGDVWAVYKPGRYGQMSREETVAWIRVDEWGIDATWTDDDLDACVEGAEDEAHDQCLATLDDVAYECAYELRDRLRAEAAGADADDE